MKIQTLKNGMTTKNNPWNYQGKIFEPTDEELKPYAGFVYEITNLSTFRKYIGKKFFWKTIKMPPLKGKKRKRLKTTQSDWPKYWGSSNELLADIEEIGIDKFSRSVIRLCNSKTECAYYELKEQMDRDVLLTHSYYNGFVGGKINGRNLLKE
jgi:hypothetical protein